MKKSKLSFFLHSSMNIFYTPDATLPRRTVLAMKRKKLLAIANDTFTPTSEIQKTTASNFIVTKHEGDWYALALQRASDKQPEPNHWGLPGGGVEPFSKAPSAKLRKKPDCGPTRDLYCPSRWLAPRRSTSNISTP